MSIKQDPIGSLRDQSSLLFYTLYLWALGKSCLSTCSNPHSLVQSSYIMSLGAGPTPQPALSKLSGFLSSQPTGLAVSPFQWFGVQLCDHKLQLASEDGNGCTIFIHLHVHLHCNRHYVPGCDGASPPGCKAGHCLWFFIADEKGQRERLALLHPDLQHEYCLRLPSSSE